MASIRIVRRKGTVGFEPDVLGSQPGDPLVVDQGEDVTWNNRTKQEHWPWPIDADGKLLSQSEALERKLFLSDMIPPLQVSEPIFDVKPDFSPQPPPPPTPGVPPRSSVPPPTIDYVCRLHPEERGHIFVRK
jgi:hypothetical protein